MNEKRKKLLWIGSSLRDLRTFPNEVKGEVGYALYAAECGGKHKNAKPLKGFKGSGVLEVIEDYQGDTYRAVYTVKLAGYVYVLHCFRKKSKKGISTLKHDLDLIKTRFQDAITDYQQREE